MILSLLATFLLISSLLFPGCAPPIAGLPGYTSGIPGYQFLYPKGWTQVDVYKVAGVDVVFHDLIETSENLSVIINPIPDNKTLTDLGTPSEVGYRLLKNNSLNPNLDKEVELIRSESHQIDGKDYYILEYQVKLANGQERHNLASVTVNNNKLYSFNLSTSQKRWTQIQELFETIVDSFSVS